MKKVFFYLLIACLPGCSLFGHSGSSELSCPSNTAQSDAVIAPHTGCPPAAFGAERINEYLSRPKVPKHATTKGDPITGKKTSQKKGIRTGEIEKPAKLTKDQKEALKRKKAEDKAIERQLKRDEKLAKQTQSAPY